MSHPLLRESAPRCAQRGSVAIIVGLSMVVLVGLVGLALDGGRLYATKTELQNGADPPQYVAGTENFYVITRYNWSSYYAMAVIELGREVKEALARQGARQP